jgi:hypothetical protein
MESIPPFVCPPFTWCLRHLRPSPQWCGERVVIVETVRRRGALSALEEEVTLVRGRMGPFETLDGLAVGIGDAVRGMPTVKRFFERMTPFEDVFLGLCGGDTLPSSGADPSSSACRTLPPCRAVHSSFSTQRQRSPTDAADVLTRSRGWLRLVWFSLLCSAQGWSSCLSHAPSCPKTQALASPWAGFPCSACIPWDDSYFLVWAGEHDRNGQRVRSRMGASFQIGAMGEEQG